MENKNLLIFLPIFLLFLNVSTSVGQDLYINENALNLFSVSKAKELKVSFHIPMEYQGMLLSSIYSPKEKLSVSAGYFRVKHEDGREARNGNLFTCAVGTYRTLNKVSKRDDKPIEMVFSAQFGYSYGNINTDIDRGYINLKFGKPFILFGFDYEMKHWGFGLRLKQNRLRFYSGTAGRLDLDSRTFRRAEQLEKEAVMDTGEFNYQINVGKGIVGFFLGANFEFGLLKRVPSFLTSNHVFVGFVFDFGKIKKESNKK